MESVFDRLAKEISGKERLALLKRISKLYKSEPLHKGIASSDEPYIPERQFARLSIFARLQIIILGFLLGISRDKAIERFLLRKIHRKIDYVAPGLLDRRRGLINPKLYQVIAKLRSAMNVFKEPILKALEDEKGEFYAFLGKLEFEDVQTRLETQLLPSSNDIPNIPHSKIKKQLFLRFNDILNDIELTQRKRMNIHTEVLFQLRSLARFPYNRILNLFPPGENGAAAGATIRVLRIPLLELGDVLFAFQTPPTSILLEAIFLFDLQDKISEDSEWLEKELRERMNLAVHSLNVVRKVNTAIPWELLLKSLAVDIHYTPTTASGVDDWFRIFKLFWTKRLNARFREWSNQKHVQELLEGLKEQYELTEIPSVPGYRGTEFPDHYKPRYELSFAVVKVLFLEIFQARLYHVLNIIKIDGKFYKKTNREDFEEAFNRFVKIPDKIRSFENKLRPDGNYGIRLENLWKETNSGTDTSKRFFELLGQLDRESQIITVPLIGDLKTMSDILGGVLSGSGGTYDSLSNMSEIGGHGNQIFLENLKEVRNIFNRSAENLKKLLEFEEKRILPGQSKETRN
ncbi:hypothetical protein S1OALGB6SA_2070 [Olavius algarvensis spirochete endosymbiont]|uniref:DUF5312 family protein n=1 Tax=Olavius algarvensis spirochete endosymbiont TaxID=260710 RepID=UPI000F1240D7|nr:DUF5312 family protein [Olavius algarvensis spirochete endosymbiont]VDB00976.1 hypothetical protein S1OALGB6SA_2070 [Olavius algarvensis spirochete endosymbiont]